MTIARRLLIQYQRRYASMFARGACAADDRREASSRAVASPSK